MNSKIKFLLFFLLFAGFFSVKSTHAKSVFLHSEEKDVLWKLKPYKEINSDFEQVLKSGYNTSSWINAVVPGTAFTAYVNAGVEKDPNFGNNIHQVDRSKYDQSFLYRTEFKIPDDFTKERIWLNFNGVNRKAEIYLNGKMLGNLDGFMHRGRFDITEIADKNKENTLVVIVHMPETPLANCGSPTYLSSGGWDWMPYVPGLNMGITDKVYLSNTGDITIIDPWIRTDLPSRARADVSVSMEVKNHSKENKKAKVTGIINPGNISFSQEINMNGGSISSIRFDKLYYPQLSIDHPQLWWPNGYGEPNMYTCTFEINIDGNISESRTIDFGIKKYTYDTIGNVLHLHINGVPVFIKGANWGMSEYMLRCRGEEYDTKIRLHNEMNFNMIRNWLGSTTDDEFYDACNKYGIMVWDDFWINSNPNLPYDINVFNANMIEKIKRVRNHPCLAVWCGDNEGNPEPPLEGWMRENIQTFDGGDRYFQANSHAGNLTGSGPWGAFDAKYYFTAYPDAIGGNRGWGLRTEIGTAVVPNFESFKKFMPQENWWPRDEMWNLHYFGPSAFNAAPDRYERMLKESYGSPSGIEDFCRKAQFVNYTSNKGMYEGWLDRMWEDASGIMTWMGQSAYPSMVWQTYDYYYDLTGAYWGCKSACEPVHILWNPTNNMIKVANTSRMDMNDLTAEVSIYNLDGKKVDSYSKSVKVNSPSNSTVQCFNIDFNMERKNLALNKPVVASSVTYGEASNVTDGKSDTRWSSSSVDNEWIYIDLGEKQNIDGVRLNWEYAYGKAYKIQTSNDANKWTDRYYNTTGKGGVEEILFGETVNARYVRLFGFERGSWYGYSLWDFDVLSSPDKSEGLTDVHFIKLQLKDKQNNIISENFYWRSNLGNDFTALNNLNAAKLKTSSKMLKNNGKAIINATISNPASAKTLAFGIHVQAIRMTDKERILPAIMNDNYFTLMPGESKQIQIEFDEKLLDGGNYELQVTPYNN